MNKWITFLSCSPMVVFCHFILKSKLKCWACGLLSCHPCAALRCIWQPLWQPRLRVLLWFEPLIEMIYVDGPDVVQILVFHSIMESCCFNYPMKNTIFLLFNASLKPILRLSVLIRYFYLAPHLSDSLLSCQWVELVRGLWNMIFCNHLTLQRSEPWQRWLVYLSCTRYINVFIYVDQLRHFC